MSDQQQSHFEGWAILEIFGHQKYAGRVRTVYYGTACMFQCDVPPLPERERVTLGGCYVETETDSRHWAPPGSTVKGNRPPRGIRKSLESARSTP